MADPLIERMERLYDAFNRRDGDGVAALCDERMEFYPVATAEAVGRVDPYRGPEGLREYFADAAKAWDELTITPSQIERRGDVLLVRGRVYARSRDLGIRDMPVAWIWEAKGERFVRGEVFLDPDGAGAPFEATTAGPGSG